MASSLQGGKYGYIFFAASLICLAWYFFFLPETKGRSLEEIDELFENKVPAWKFKTYKTVILEQALQEVQKHGAETDEKPAMRVEETLES